MSMTMWLLLSCAVAYATKFSGYLVPQRFLENPRMTRISGTLTIGLLASLTAMNTFAAAGGVALDARVGALMAAALALWLRAPFLLVVIVGAVAAALLRLGGV